jgi:hypothetical protein
MFFFLLAVVVFVLLDDLGGIYLRYRILHRHQNLRRILSLNLKYQYQIHLGILPHGSLLLHELVDYLILSYHTFFFFKDL